VGGTKENVSDIQPKSLDHVALWVERRDPLAEFLCDHLGMHVIERGDDFTLVGADARRGKLTLFDAEGPRDPGVLGRVVIRVGDLDAALQALPGDLPVERRDGIAEFDAPEGLSLGLTKGDGPDYDLDHVLLRAPDPERTAAVLADLGFERRNGALAVADKEVRIERGGGTESERPLLNHLALLVESATEIRDEAERRGLVIEKFVDAENTLAVFVRGPDGVVIEYVEHKPGFSLV
jgi:catechol 2,3-dioxygenase-like lactoylglutathione lyase family enzyme